MKWEIVLLMLLVLAPGAIAQTGSIHLLALSEQPDGQDRGILASLSLNVRIGTERVFLETLPLTRVATQISMRFAQQVACKELRKDCSRNDFIYTIVASPGLVGGPSAGAAASVLTVALLEDFELRTDVAITGTINSGGLLGPVGGLKAKIEAAGRNGVTTVLIPKGSRLINDRNLSEDLQEIGRRNNVSVIEVATLAEAVYHFTGKKR